MRTVYLVSYDICDDRRLHKVHKTMVDFGRRLQYSVYECFLSRAQMAHLLTTLAGLIDSHVDQVLFVELGPEGADAVKRIESLGRPYTRHEHRAVVL
jgi:CRISPR-associated protein Cas2